MVSAYVCTQEGAMPVIPEDVKCQVYKGNDIPIYTK